MKNVKKLLLVMMLLVSTLPATSQSLRDYIRSRAGNADSLVLKAVSPALGIIRQQYRLERNGEFFGKNKRQFYGETYTLSVKVPGSTILQHAVVFPWNNDDDYLRVNRGGKYRPVHFRSMQRKLTDNDWQSVELELGTQYVSILSPDSLLYRHSDAMSDFGLPVDETDGLKHGYLIWAYSTTNLQDSSMQVKLQSSSYQINVKSDSASVKLKPENTENLLGGIFVVPTVERAGHIKLYLVGVISQKVKDEWFLNLLIKKTGEVTRIEEPIKSDKQKKKRKKNEPEQAATETLDESEPTPIR